MSTGPSVPSTSVAYIVMAYIVMAYIVMAYRPVGAVHIGGGGGVDGVVLLDEQLQRLDLGRRGLVANVEQPRREVLQRRIRPAIAAPPGMVGVCTCLSTCPDALSKDRSEML